MQFDRENAKRTQVFDSQVNITSSQIKLANMCSIFYFFFLAITFSFRFRRTTLKQQRGCHQQKKKLLISMKLKDGNAISSLIVTVCFQSTWCMGRFGVHPSPPLRIASYDLPLLALYSVRFPLTQGSRLKVVPF